MPEAFGWVVAGAKAGASCPAVVTESARAARPSAAALSRPVIHDNVAALLVDYPAMRTPAAPLPARPDCPDRRTRSMKQPYLDLAAQVGCGQYRLRAPAATSIGLAEVCAMGYCMDPVIRHGDYLYFDAAMPADDGDIVCFAWDPGYLARLIDARIREGDERWLKTYAHVPNLGVHQLVHVAHEYEHVLCEETGAIPLGNNRVLGVLRYVIRGRTALYGSGEAAMCKERAHRRAREESRSRAHR